MILEVYKYLVIAKNHARLYKL